MYTGLASTIACYYNKRSVYDREKQDVGRKATTTWESLWAALLRHTERIELASSIYIVVEERSSSSLCSVFDIVSLSLSIVSRSVHIKDTYRRYFVFIAMNNNFDHIISTDRAEEDHHHTYIYRLIGKLHWYCRWGGWKVSCCNRRGESSLCCDL